MKRITHLSKSPEQASLPHQFSDSHTTADLDTLRIRRRWWTDCMRCTDHSHSADHRLVMVGSWGLESSGDHTAAGIGHIVGWDTPPARCRSLVQATVDSVVVSHMSYCGHNQVYYRSQPQLVVEVRVEGFVGERSLSCIRRRLDCCIPHSPAQERERIPCSQKNCLRGRQCQLSVTIQ